VSHTHPATTESDVSYHGQGRADIKQIARSCSRCRDGRDRGLPAPGTSCWFTPSNGHARATRCPVCGCSRSPRRRGLWQRDTGGHYQEPKRWATQCRAAAGHDGSLRGAVPLGGRSGRSG
jgi:hypothetical protein